MASTNAEMYGRTVQECLRKYGPLDFPTLLSKSGLLEEQKVRQGLRFSRRTNDNNIIANEIVAVATDLSGTPIYFLAASDAQAEDYETRRRAIALGHITSVIVLEEKRYEKWPNPSRQAAIKMLAMAHNLLATAGP